MTVTSAKFPIRSAIGSRDSEVGIIPQNWDCLTVASLIKEPPKNGYSGRTVDDKTGTPTLSLAATTSGRLVLDETTVKYLKERIPRGSSLFLEPDDVLVQRSNTAELVGTTAIYDGPPQTFVYPDLMMRLRFKQPETAHWFWHCANSRIGRSFFRTVAAGSTGSMPKISGAALKQMMLPLPPLAEQRAIASALSDVDALIGALDKGIAKKCAIKLATMQQLLTGKTRLPGFTGKYREQELGDLGRFSKGRGIKREDMADTGVPCIRYGEIYTRYNDYVFRPASLIPMSIAASALPIQKGDILFAGSGETAEEIGKCVAYLGTEQAYAGGDIIVLTPLSDNPLYLGYLLNLPIINEQKARYGQGDAVVHISSSNLARIKLRLPSLDEQRSIAEVLLNMDTEIAALEQRREKTRAIKHGMMQALLTGQVRLMKPEANE